MLSNIASIELPRICQTLSEWLNRKADVELQRPGIERNNIGEGEFWRS